MMNSNELKIDKYYFDLSFSELLSFFPDYVYKYKEMVSSLQNSMVTDVFFYGIYDSSNYCIVFEKVDSPNSNELEEWLDLTFSDQERVISQDFRYIRVYTNDQQDLLAARLGPYGESIFAVISKTNK